MKPFSRVILFAGALILIYSSVLFSASIEQETSSKKDSPALWETNHNDTAIVPLPGDKTPPASIVDNRPRNVLPNRHWMCETGYYCVVTQKGYLPNCILGTPPYVGEEMTPTKTQAKDCNIIARECRKESLSGDKKVYYDKYCKI